MKHIVVVGAGQAGFSVVSKLRNLQFDGSITLIGNEPVPPYQRPPLSKKYLLGEMDVERLYLRPLSFYNDYEINLKLGQLIFKISESKYNDIKNIYNVDQDTLEYRIKECIKSNFIDLDLEQGAYVSQAGTISNPSSHITYVITALQELLSWYQTTYSKKMILTMAPEVAYTVGGLSNYMSSTYGASYLAIIEALQDDIDLVMVQLYNASGGSYGLDNVIYYEGSADFIVSQTEAIIKGFTCKNSKGTYTGLRANQVAVALPSRTNASGYCSPAIVKSAVDYLRGTGSKPGSYTLQKVGGYKGLRGLMTWSINEDKDNANAFVNNYASIFTSCLSANVESVEAAVGFQIYPNPSEGFVFIQGSDLKGKTLSLYNSLGALVMQQQTTDNKILIDISGYSTGLYLVNVDGEVNRFIVK